MMRGRVGGEVKGGQDAEGVDGGAFINVGEDDATELDASAGSGGGKSGGDPFDAADGLPKANEGGAPHMEEMMDGLLAIKVGSRCAVLLHVTADGDTIVSIDSGSGLLNELDMVTSSAAAVPAGGNPGRVMLLEDLFDACDDDGSGALSIDEFSQLFDSRLSSRGEIRGRLQLVDVQQNDGKLSR